MNDDELLDQMMGAVDDTDDEAGADESHAGEESTGDPADTGGTAADQAGDGGPEGEPTGVDGTDEPEDKELGGESGGDDNESAAATGEPDGAGEGDAKDPIDEKYEAVEKGLRTDKSRNNFKELIDDLKATSAERDTLKADSDTVKSDLDRIKSEYEPMRDRVVDLEEKIRGANMQEGELGDQIELIRLRRSPNPDDRVRAAEIMQGEIAQIQASLIADNVRPPEAKPLFEQFPDIQQMVAQGAMPVDQAQQLAALRMQYQRGAQQQSYDRQQQQSQSQQTQVEQQAVQDVGQWLEGIAKADADYQHKDQQLAAFAADLRANKVDPQAWPGLIKGEYNRMTEAMAKRAAEDNERRAKEAQQRQPVRQNPVGASNNAAPASMEDAIFGALGV